MKNLNFKEGKHRLQSISVSYSLKNMYALTL